MGCDDRRAVDVEPQNVYGLPQLLFTGNGILAIGRRMTTCVSAGLPSMKGLAVPVRVRSRSPAAAARRARRVACDRDCAPVLLRHQLANLALDLLDQTRLELEG